jgi:hypothetical protein
MRRRTVDTTIKSIKFQNSHIVYENFAKCTIKDYEYNLTYNPTLLSGSQGVLTPYSSSLGGDVYYINTGSNENYGILKNFYTGSEFSPYATTVGLYNDAQELLAIAKMSAPMPLAANTDMTFLVKFDTAWADRNYFVPSPTPSPSPIYIIEGTAELLTGIPVSPSVTPSITTTPSVTPSITRTPSVTPSITRTPSITPTVTPSISLDALASPSVTPSITRTPSITPTRTPSVTPSPSPAYPTVSFTQGSLPWTYLYSTRPQGTVANNTGVNLYIYLGAGINFASTGPASFTSGGGYSILNVNGTYGFVSYSTSYVTLAPGLVWPFAIDLSSGTAAYFDVDLYYSTTPGGTLTRLSSL